MIFEIPLRTNSRTEFINITSQVHDAVVKSGVREGVCLVYAPHTTAGLTINENADPDVTEDIASSLEKLAPWKAGYEHMEGNSAAHIKSSILGVSKQIIVNGGRLVLGTWQGIFFVEFDGPRTRKVFVKVLSEK